MDLLKANKLIRRAGITGIIISAISFIGAVFVAIYDNNYYDIGMFLVLAIFVYSIFRKSRIGSSLFALLFVGGCIFNATNMVLAYGLRRMVLAFLPAAILSYIFIQGARGVFAYHKLTNKNVNT